mgnify:CR=1 FL=1
MVPADGVGSFPQGPKITLKITAVFPAVYKRNGVEYDVAVQMLPVKVGGDHCLIAISQQAAGKFYTSGVGLLRCDFARSIGVDDVIPQNTSRFVPPAFCSLHF